MSEPSALEMKVAGRILAFVDDALTPARFPFDADDVARLIHDALAPERERTRALREAASYAFELPIADELRRQVLLEAISTALAAFEKETEK